MKKPLLALVALCAVAGIALLATSPLKRGAAAPGADDAHVARLGHVGGDLGARADHEALRARTRSAYRMAEAGGLGVSTKGPS